MTHVGATEYTDLDTVAYYIKLSHSGESREEFEVNFDTYSLQVEITVVFTNEITTPVQIVCYLLGYRLSVTTKFYKSA